MRQRLIQSISTKIDRRFLLYALAFTAVSFIPTWYVYQLMFHSSALVGADPANHTVFIKQIVESKDLLFPIAQFYPDDPGSGYYPMFPAAIIAGLHLLTKIDVIEILRFFMFFAFMGGQLGYALLSIKLANNNLNKGLFIYAVFIFGSALLIKTLRDGSYGEVFAFWFLLPFLLNCLLRYRLVWSALLLAFIFASNIPATFGISFLLVAFLIFYSVDREWKKVKFIFKVILIAVLLASPVLYYTYFLKAINSSQGEVAEYSTSPFLDGYPSCYVPLFTIGLLCIAGVLIYYRGQRWIGLWTALYVFVIFSPFLSVLSERFLREMSIPLSLSVGIVFYDLAGLAASKLRSFRFWDFFENEALIKSVLLILCFIVIFGYGRTRIAAEADPVVGNYFTPLKLDAYQWLNEQTEGQEVGVVTVSTMDPWAKVYVNSRIWEILSPSISAELLGDHDISINDDLAASIMPPPNPSALLERSISYIFLSSPLPDRWYEAENEEFVNELMNIISNEDEPYYKLVYCRQSDEETITIYKIEYGGI